MWTCSKCDQQIEEAFDACWNCGAAIDGRNDPHFVSENTPIMTNDSARDVEPVQFSLVHLIGLMTIVGIFFAVGPAIVIQVLFALTICVVMFALFGLTVLFLYWTLVYLIFGERFLDGKPPRCQTTRNAPLRFDVWVARQTLEDQAQP